MRARATGTGTVRAAQRPGLMRGGPAAVSGPAGEVMVMAVPRSCVPCGLGAEVAQHGQDTAVVPVAGRQPQLGEDVVDVLLDRTAADDEGVSDGGVGPALGHQG